MSAREWPCLALVNQGEPCREWLVMHEKPPPLPPEHPKTHSPIRLLALPCFWAVTLHFVLLTGSPLFRACLFLPFIAACNPKHPLLSTPLHSAPLLWGKSESQESTYREPGVFTSHKRDDISCERISVPRQG